ncbi:MAG: restriction endonuclease subunit S [Flavobacteriales bacterium]|nr:restriction endonuclease subunit S [Flavobacteriales bacterium]
MSKEMKLIPELRFPEFEKEGEWKIESINDLCEILNNIRKPVTSSDRKSGEYPYYGASGIIDFIDDYLFEEQLLLVGEDGAKWGSFENTAFLVKGKYWVNNHAHVLKPIGIDDKLLESYLVKLDLQPYITGAAPPKLTLGKLKEIPVPTPQKPQEQQKIASCLSSLDELIAAHSDKLDALKDHKKGLMQNLFPQDGETVPKVRFSEFEGDGDWLPTTVEDNCLVKGRIGYRGYTTQDIVGQGEGALVLGGKHIQNQLLELKDPTYLSWDKYYESPEIMVEVGHIIFSQRGTLGDCAIIDREIGPATINPSMVLIKNITCDARFLYYILIGDCIQEEVRKNRSNGAIPMLSQKQIKEFSFLIPEPQEQQKIASCLSALDALITAQTEKIEQLQQYKKGLMQGLFPKIEN